MASTQRPTLKISNYLNTLISKFNFFLKIYLHAINSFFNMSQKRLFYVATKRYSIERHDERIQRLRIELTGTESSAERSVVELLFEKTESEAGNESD